MTESKNENESGTQSSSTDADSKPGIKSEASQDNSTTTSNASSPSGDVRSGGQGDAGENNVMSTPEVVTVSEVNNTGGGKGLSLLAILLSMAALAASGYAWYQTAVNARISGGEQINRLQSVEQQFDTVKDAQSGVTEQISKIRQQVADSETGVLDQVSQVKQLISSTESALVNQISEVKQQLIKSEGTVGEQIREIRGELESGQQSVVSQVSESQKGFEQQSLSFRSEFDTLSGSIVDLKSELGTSVDSWSLREIEHLLVMANQRLQLSKDAKVARQALQIAESRMQDLDDPALLPARQALSQEIAALALVKSVDVAGVSNSITLLAKTLENLPIAGDVEVSGLEKSATSESEAAPSNSSASTSTADKIAGIGKSFLADLGSLVQIEKGGKPVAPSITPEIASLTLARGRLMLEGAQIALLRQQSGVYRDRLNAAESWVNEKFDTSNDQTANWLSQLEKLKNVSPKVEIPDISGSLAALRSVIGTEG